MKDSISRRTFVTGFGTGAAGAFLAITGRKVKGELSSTSANNRVNLGLIGCGARGQELLGLALVADSAAITMVCDVDSQRSARAADMVERAGRKRPAAVKDYQKILDDKNIDGVIIASPDHWHALQHLHACAAGKDMYLETPICHNITEGLNMRQITRKSRRVVQVGLQQRSATWFKETAKKVRSGSLGRIAQTRSWTFAKIEPIARKPDCDPPVYLDYDRWLGPAPKRKYNPARSHGKFVNWWDYSGGTMCKWNPHLMDVMNAFMRVNAPKSVVAIGNNQGLKDFRETPDTLEAVFEYEGLEGPFMHTYSLRLSNGHAGWGPPIPGHNGEIDVDHSMHYGVQFHGNDNTLFVDRSGRSFFKTGPRQPENLPKPKQESSSLEHALTMDHLNDFINCIRTREEPKAPIDTGMFALLPCQLANISYRLGKKIYYDGQTQKCYLDADRKEPAPAVAEFLFRKYREPYTPYTPSVGGAE